MILKFLKRFEKEIAELREWATGKEYVYDIECYPNIWTCAVVHVKSLQCYYFECSPWLNNMEEFQAFVYYLNHHECEMIGFNNQGYDWPVTDTAFRMIPAGVTPADIYAKSKAIFDTPYEDRNKHVIWPSRQYIKQVDLFKINHFDNKGVSLKMLENNMDMEDIQDLPIEPNTYVTQPERDGLASYNFHDVAATLLFLHKCMGAIDLRRSLGVKFNHDFTNASEAKIGADIFKLKLREAGLPVDQKTIREEIVFSDCIFDYVRFERPEFVQVLNFLKGMTITKTKEALNDIAVPWDLAQYMNPDEVIVHGACEEMLLPDVKRVNITRGVKLSQIDPDVSLAGCHFVATHLHVVVNGFQFDFGTGGIHGSVTSQIVRSTDTHDLIDVDVASYYPNIGIRNKIYPAHLGTPFCDIKEGLYEERKLYPKKTKPMENKAFKLAMNAAYGNSNNRHSFLFDSVYTMTVTLNGQLMLCMLSEELFKVPGLTLVQINTDGVTYLTPKEYTPHTMNLCRWWEGLTNLELEDVPYKAMYIRDVNNYIAEKTDGGLKNIGAYAYAHAKNGAWDKNFDCRIVAMAAEEALVRGGNVRDFIYSHLNNDDNRFLFTLKTKVDRNTKVVINTPAGDEVCQRITRYYAAINGGKLIKIMKPTDKQIKKYIDGNHYRHIKSGDYKVVSPTAKPPAKTYIPVPHDERPPIADRRISIESSCMAAQCNKIDQFNWDNLNVEWYITQANKLVDPLL